MDATVQSIFTNVVQFKKIDPSTLNRKKQRVVKDICTCKTEERGFHVDKCQNCGHEMIFYNSCKNPCCPKCQAVEKEIWAMKQEFYVLNTHYFHVVFTIPAELNQLALIDPVLIYNLLFESSAETLKELSADPKYLGAKIGFTSVLHTWGANLSLHPHVHCIVSGGGIDKMGRWRTSKQNFFIPVRVISEVFKGKYLSKLKKSFDPGKLSYQNEFQEIIDSCYAKNWNVYTKKPMKEPSSVIKYLARYTHRIAISNGRIVSYDGENVTFKYKDYQDESQIKEMTLTDTEFVRRFLMHVPPYKFMRIRHYGFLGNCNKKERVKLLRSLTHTPVPTEFKPDKVKIISKILKKDISKCPCCGQLRHPLLE